MHACIYAYMHTHMHTYMHSLASIMSVTYSCRSLKSPLYMSLKPYRTCNARACMYLCMYLCMYVCMCLYVCVYVHVIEAIPNLWYICMHVCMHLCACVYVCVYAQAYTIAYTYTYTYMRAGCCTCFSSSSEPVMHVYACMHLFACVCVCAYICMYKTYTIAYTYTYTHMRAWCYTCCSSSFPGSSSGSYCDALLSYTNACTYTYINTCVHDVIPVSAAPLQDPALEVVVTRSSRTQMHAHIRI